ncbi:MAG TPA: glycosyltransferase family 4 protein [Anaerolineae bacterium]|nr:glycosyltransferase family 4 protein [Anaerolineae bacterium]
MNGALRILMLVFNATGRGTYWRAFHLGRSLARRGHEVTVVTMAPSSRLRLRTYRKQGVTVIEAPDLLWGSLRSGWDPWAALRRILWMRNHTFDLVHAFEARPTVLLPALYMQRRGIPLVMDWCDWFGRGGSVEERPNRLIRTVLRPIETFFEERFRTRANGTIVICTTLYQKAIELGVAPQTILFLRDGADTDGIQPLDRDASRHALNLPRDVQMIGYVGAIYHRDAELMAQAFDRIHAALPSTRLLLIGYVNAPIEQMVVRPEAVIRTGTLDYTRINAYLAACDVCWLPYCDSGANRGRWPMKFNDYMAAGRPTLATAVGDVIEVMQEYEIGVLTQDAADDLAGNILALLADPERCARLGRNARQVAEQVFAWHWRVPELEAFYASILNC